MNYNSQPNVGNGNDEINQKEELRALYSAASAELFDTLSAEEIAALAKRLDEVDLYVLALINFFNTGKSGQHGLITSDLKDFIKNKRLFFGERLIFNALARLEIVGAIENRTAFKRMRVYLLKPNGEGLDFLLYEVNKQYIDFADQIAQEFKFETNNK